MAMSTRIREKQNIEVSDHNFFTVFSGKQTLYFNQLLAGS